MTDTRTITVEALAAALASVNVPIPWPHDRSEQAAAIFAALPAEPADAGLRCDCEGAAYNDLHYPDCPALAATPVVDQPNIDPGPLYADQPERPDTGKHGMP